MLGTAEFETDQGKFILEDINIPVGSKVSDTTDCIIMKLAQEFDKSSRSVTFDLDGNRATIEIIIQKNKPFEIVVEYDYKTKEKAIDDVQNGSLLLAGFDKLVDYLMECSFKLNIGK